MLEVKDLHLSFGGVKAINGCDIRVEAGTITGLIGPNGAGKTTLFNAISGSLRPDSGEVFFEGRNVTDLSAKARFDLGMARTFQIPREFHRLSVFENLVVSHRGQRGEHFWYPFASPRAVREDEDHIGSLASSTIDFLGLGAVRDVWAGHLSGGQKKLVEIGRAIMADAKFVLLDEPAAGVNRTLLQAISEKLRALNGKGMTFLVIEHDMPFVGTLCDPVICLSEGRVLCSGSHSEVTRSPEVISAYLG